MSKQSPLEITQPSMTSILKHMRDGRTIISMKTIQLARLLNSKSISKKFLSNKSMLFQIKDWIQKMRDSMSRKLLKLLLLMIMLRSSIGLRKEEMILELKSGRKYSFCKQKLKKKSQKRDHHCSINSKLLVQPLLPGKPKRLFAELKFTTKLLN